MRQLKLSTKPLFALVDDDVHDRVFGSKRYATRRKSQAYPYVYRFVEANGSKTCERLHRHILGVIDGIDLTGKVIDHINGDPLDNRRENLRVCVDRQNLRNQSMRRVQKTSAYKGVSQSKNHRRWRASIFVDYKRVHIGYFDTPEQAAEAYDNAARSMHGEYARTNREMGLLPCS